jgi:fructooligosaccharide transport system permease protein
MIFGVLILILGVASIFDIRKAKKTRDRYKLKSSLFAYLIIGPILLLISIFVLQPIVMGLAFGFTDYYLLEPSSINFVGLDNFKDLLAQYQSRGDIYHAFRNTLQFMLLVLPLQIGLALLLALILHQARRGNGYFKVAFFAPVVMSLTVVSILWLQILNPNQTELGLMNTLFGLLGFPPSTFLLDPSVAMYWIVIISAWQGAGFQMLIFLAGLKNISNDMYDAAKMDGADSFETVRFITLPQLKPTFVFVMFTTFIGASKLLIQPMVMIGFKNYSMTLSYLIYREGYQFRFVGYASAIALVVTIFVGTLVILQRRAMKEEK